jgi:hypothetical protein
MDLILKPEDLGKLKPETVAELVGLVAGKEQERGRKAVRLVMRVLPLNSHGMDYEGVVDLSPEQVSQFMAGVSDQTREGLKVFAEHGPILDVTTGLLDDVGIENYGHFQGRVTKRARTVTGDPEAYLLGYDEWEWNDKGDTLEKGRFGVTQTTYDSLRKYFGLI